LTPGIPEAVAEFLGRPTCQDWIDAAAGALPALIVDHANCEKKAAATAISLMHRYPGRTGLVQRMSRLAREELRHFEQVTRLMHDAGIPWRYVSASRYASGLRSAVSSNEPDRLIDLLVVGAFIEARSCERFALLAPVVPAPFEDFYRGLLASESRHFTQYLGLAGQYAPGGDAEILKRSARIRQRENALIGKPDCEVRFHSGPPG
jgi:tRNA-(ms[2]io[6]A)-hydroxylase